MFFLLRSKIKIIVRGLIIWRQLFFPHLLLESSLPPPSEPSPETQTNLQLKNCLAFDKAAFSIYYYSDCYQNIKYQTFDKAAFSIYYHLVSEVFPTVIKGKIRNWKFTNFPIHGKGLPATNMCE